jgi:hypothetical protein
MKRRVTQLKKGTMNRTYSLLAAAVVAWLVTAPVRAEETNAYPKSNVELFEATTGIIIIRSYDEMGDVPGKLGGGVTVKCREARDPATNRREFGVMMIVTAPQGGEDTTIVDFDKVDPLIHAMDYVSKVDWSVTSMGHLEAGYTTRSGFKIASFSSTRSGLIEAFAFSNRNVRARCALTMDQLVRLRVLVEQAKTRIEVIQREK